MFFVVKSFVFWLLSCEYGYSLCFFLITRDGVSNVYCL